MDLDYHKKYEVTYWESDRGHGVVQSFNLYSEALEYMRKLPKSKFDTVRIQETLALYVKGRLIEIG